MSTARDIASWLATETRKGPVELATQAEVDTGTDAERAITPATWGGPSPGGLIDVQVFTANGTWTKPAGCESLEVTVIGAGGGGAGAGTSDASFRFGGGGGGGGYASGMFLASVFGSTVTVVVGGGGSGGAAGENDGSTGGQSTFDGVSVQASGGQGATAAGSDNAFGGAGSGGTSFVSGEISNTQLNTTGGNGSRHGAVGSTYQPLAGGCPSGPWSGGQNVVAGVVDPGSYAVTGIDAPANRPGTGGNGAAIRGGAATRAGGDGSDGIVIVRSYG